MRFNKNSHPILKKLKSKDIGVFALYESDADQMDQRKVIEGWFKKVSLGVNSSIYYMTKPFLEAYELAGDALYKSNLWHEVEDENICFIGSSGAAYVLNIRNNIEEKYITADCINFNGNVLTSYGNIILDYTTDQPDRKYALWESKNAKNSEYTVFNLVIITLFIKYAKVETKYLKPKSSATGVNCIYKNESEMPVTVLDSLWFTNLVKSDGFTVRGHFRMQPKKKDGQWTKELIWINTFEKSGYTRKAGIENRVEQHV